MQSGEIIVFRYRGDIHVGRYQSATANKIKAATGQNRVYEIPSDRVLIATGITEEDESALDGFRRAMEQGAEQIELKDVWELLKEEGVSCSFQDIAELFWGNDLTAGQYAGTLLHLSRSCPYFSDNGTEFTPLPDDRVEANLTRIERRQETLAEYEVFMGWIKDGAAEIPEWFTNRQRHWLTRIRQFAILGDEYDQSAQAKELLQEIREGSAGGDLRRYAFDLMVHKGFWDEDEHLDLIRYDIPVAFDESIGQEAAAVTVDEEGREDLSRLNVFSIDDAETMDVDDALSLETTDTGYRIGVHITDVSAVISKDSPLDRIAQERVTSLYFPDRHIPMLPPELSQGRCSLLQGQRRCAVSFFYEVDPDFTLLRHTIVPSVIVNHHKLSYQEVDRMLETNDHPLAGTIGILNEAVDVFYAQRIEHGAIEVERTDLSINVDAEKRITVALRKGQSRAEHIVSELMILANVMVARYFAEHQAPAIYRTQSEPSLTGIDESPHNVVRRFRILRQLKPLELSLEPKPHAMLGVDVYCQITSPLRRYSDLTLQRQLMSWTRHSTLCYTGEELTDEISRLERSRNLNKIWAQREWYWLLKYLAGQSKPVLMAVVLEVRERDVLVELLDYGSRLTMRLTSRAEVGDEIKTRVTQADPWGGILRLVQVER